MVWKEDPKPTVMVKSILNFVSTTTAMVDCKEMPLSENNCDYGWMKDFHLPVGP